MLLLLCSAASELTHSGVCVFSDGAGTAREVDEMAITFWQDREEFLAEATDCGDGGGEVRFLDGAARRSGNKGVDFDVQK